MRALTTKKPFRYLIPDIAVKRGILIFLILASLELFRFIPLAGLVNPMSLAAIGIMIAVVLFHIVYDKGHIPVKMNFSLEVILILVSVFLSMFIAYAGHGQDFTTTLIAQRFMYFHLFYFVLHIFHFDRHYITRLIIYLGLVYVVLYIIQYILYPTILFGGNVREDRGTVRIFLAGLGYAVTAYFICLFQYFAFKRARYLFLMFIFLIIFILMGTRQLLFGTIFLTLMSIIFSKKVHSKFGIISLSILSVIPVYFMFQEIFQNMVEVTLEQRSEGDENIRVRAALFFLGNLFPNKMAYILGNGAHSLNSSFGQKIWMYKEVFGFYQSDIGIIGDYTKFGILFVVAEIMIIVKAIRLKQGEYIKYIRYLFIFKLFTLFTGGGFLTSTNAMVSNYLILYILDIYLAEQKQDSVVPSETVDQKPEVLYSG